MTIEPKEFLRSRLEQIVIQDQIDTGNDEDRQIGVEVLSFPFSVDASVTFEIEISEEAEAANTRDTRKVALAKLDTGFNDRLQQGWLEAYLSDPKGTNGFKQFIRPLSASYSRTCHTCGGTCRVTCRSCHGKGRTHCSSCSNGKVSCSSCGGAGRLRCSGCNGNGRQSYSENVPYTGVGGKTFYRLETRYRPCSGCGGSGYSAYCSCQNGQRDCSACSGRGEVQCRGCSGRGENRCSTCQGTGNEGFKITHNPIIEDSPSYICADDQATFDHYASVVPGFLTQRSAAQRQGLKHRSDGKTGHYQYHAVAYAARTLGEESEPALILGHESMEPRRSSDYLHSACARTTRLLENDELSELNAFPLGQACLEAVRHKPPHDLGEMSKFDPEQRLTASIEQARQRLALKLTDGEYRSMAKLCGIAFAVLLAVLLIPISGPVSPFLAKLYFGIPLYGAWIAWFIQSKRRRERRAQRALEAIGQEVELGTGVLKVSAAALAAAQALAFVVAAQVDGSQVCRLERGFWDNVSCGIGEYLFGLTLVLQ